MQLRGQASDKALVGVIAGTLTQALRFCMSPSGSKSHTCHQLYLHVKASAGTELGKITEGEANKIEEKEIREAFVLVGKYIMMCYNLTPWLY